MLNLKESGGRRLQKISSELVDIRVQIFLVALFPASLMTKREEKCVQN